MKLHFTDEWLRSRIMDEPDVCFEIGPELESASPFMEIVHAQEEARSASIRKAASRERTLLSIFLAKLRSRDDLTFKQMAERLGVSEIDVRQTETNPLFEPTKRFIERIAGYVNQPVFEVQRLASNKQKTSGRGDVLMTGIGLVSSKKRRRKTSEDFAKLLSKKDD